MSKQEYSHGVGLDLGTMNVVAARQTADGKSVETKRIRDAFLDLDLDAKKTLRLSKVDYVERDGTLVVLGDSALTMANLFNREVRRPLSRGVIAAGELDAQQILGLLISNVVGEPTTPGEHCYYSVPAAPVDDASQDIVYHQEVFRKILRELGYTPHPMNEAMAIIYSQCAAENFSGVAISLGSGMANLALAFQTIKGMEFSVARCLASDVEVFTETGVKQICQIVPGEDKVLDGHGSWVPVLEVLNNGPRDKLLEVCLEGLPGTPSKMTADHQVFVKSRFGWEWARAETLSPGTVVGVPAIKPTTDSSTSFPDMVEYKVGVISEVPYSGDVFDLKVASTHHSFSTYGMLVHNCGDWIDSHAAKAVGSTAARMCAIKERGVDLASPKSRDEEAIALYIRALVRYVLENISVQFRNNQAAINLPSPVPLVVSGGTTRAGGFMHVFNEELEAIKKRGFPIEISEVRAAKDPMTAVAEGLLVLAAEEHAE